jgi:hypothetical protein
MLRKPKDGVNILAPWRKLAVREVQEGKGVWKQERSRLRQRLQETAATGLAGQKGGSLTALFAGAGGTSSSGRRTSRCPMLYILR